MEVDRLGELLRGEATAFLALCEELGGEDSLVAIDDADDALFRCLRIRWRQFTCRRVVRIGGTYASLSL